MNCANHPELASLANCKRCFKPFCQNCLISSGGDYYCAQCSPKPDHPLEIRADSESLCRPGTAFGLGLIPGVGAICNGEYLKAFVHVLIFGFLISIADGPGLGIFKPLFDMLTAAFYFYMPLEAYHTARRRVLESRGLMVPKPEGSTKADSLRTGVLLTLMGLIFLLNNMIHGFIEQIIKLWPIVLIGFGSVKLWEHFRKERLGEERR